MFEEGGSSGANTDGSAVSPRRTGFWFFRYLRCFDRRVLRLPQSSELKQALTDASEATTD